MYMEYTSGFPVFLAIKFQVISMFCPGQKGHSPGIVWTILASKGKCQRRSKIARAQNLEIIV